MTQEDKQLLLKDLCARLPYGVKVQVADYKTPVELSHIDTKNGNGRKPYCFVFAFEPERIKPYLRPMSSMTDNERDELHVVGGVMSHNLQNDSWAISAFTPEAYDWLNAHHFDYHRLIEKGLALEAPK